MWLYLYECSTTWKRQPEHCSNVLSTRNQHCRNCCPISQGILVGRVDDVTSVSNSETLFLSWRTRWVLLPLNNRNSNGPMTTHLGMPLRQWASSKEHRLLKCETKLIAGIPFQGFNSLISVWRVHVTSFDAITSDYLLNSNNVMRQEITHVMVCHMPLYRASANWHENSFINADIFSLSRGP